MNTSLIIRYSAWSSVIQFTTSIPLYIRHSAWLSVIHPNHSSLILPHLNHYTSVIQPWSIVIHPDHSSMILPHLNHYIHPLFSLIIRHSTWSFALITARHLGFYHAEPRSGAIFIRLVFCHGPPLSKPPSRASIRCNIHEVCLLSRPAIWDFCMQNLGQVQYSGEDGGFVIKANSSFNLPHLNPYTSIIQPDHPWFALLCQAMAIAISNY